MEAFGPEPAVNLYCLAKEFNTKKLCSDHHHFCKFLCNHIASAITTEEIASALFLHDRVVFYEAADKGPDYYFCNPGQICGPGQSQYLGLDKARQLFNPNKDLLSFINSHCGTSITSTAWGCQPGEFEYDGAMYSGCAVINLNDVNTLEFDVTYGQDVVRTW